MKKVYCVIRVKHYATVSDSVSCIMSTNNEHAARLRYESECLLAQEEPDVEIHLCETIAFDK